MPRRAALLLATAWTIALSCSSEVSGWLCGSYTCPVGFELRPNHADLRRCPMEYLQRSQCCTSEGWNHACCMHFTRCGNSSRQDDFGWAESCCENTEDPNICCVSTAPSTAPRPHTELDHLLRAPVLITSHQGLQLTASSGVVGLNGDTGNLQKWTMTDATNGKYFITSHQGLQLEDRNGVVGLNEDTGNLQKWTITDATNGTYFITSHQGFQLGAHNFWDKYRSEDVPRVHLTEIMGGDQKWTLSGSCETCDLVPCGYCQHGCEYSSCTEEDVGIDKEGATGRNGCDELNGIPNYWQIPPTCRACTAARECTTESTPTPPPPTPTESTPTPTPPTPTESTPTPTPTPTESTPTPTLIPCASCDLVPCGYCQAGCPFSTCTDEGQVDKVGATSRNGCATVDGVKNSGQTPTQCRPAPCASCGLVPCGFCQEGCPPSDCAYETIVDKPDATSRNGCTTFGGVKNFEEVPPQCRSAPCASCDSVPCGHCQEGCPVSTCTYENEADKPFATERNGCATVDNVPNAGFIPLKCLPAPCASCDSVPCGYCQEGCSASTCDYAGGGDKVGATSRNDCQTVSEIRNSGELPTKCRAGATPTATVTVSMILYWKRYLPAGITPAAISLPEQATLTSVFQTELEALFSTMSLAFDVTHEISLGYTSDSSDAQVWTSSLVATSETNNPDAFSAVSESLLDTHVRAAVDTALPGKIHGSDGSGGGMSTSVSKLASTASTEEDGSGGGMGTGALIAMLVGAVAVVGLVGAIAYRQWSRRNPIQDHHGAQGETPFKTTMSGLELAGVDACLSAADDGHDEFTKSHSMMNGDDSDEEFTRSQSVPANTKHLSPTMDMDDADEEFNRSHSVPEKFFEDDKTQHLSTTRPNPMNVADVEQGQAPSA